VLVSVVTNSLQEVAPMSYPFLLAGGQLGFQSGSRKYKAILDSFLLKMSFEMVYTPEWQHNMPNIRDEKDKPVLASAIIADVDVLITGDKDFYDVEIERPEILSPAGFWEKY
jgi:predicted nucleic acid-binding protein